MASVGAHNAACVTLAGVRLVNGTLGLLVPQVLIRRIDGQRSAGPAATYAFRLFGIRTVLLGLDLLATDAEQRRHCLDQAPLVHGSDTVTAAVLALGGQVPRRSGALLVAVSAVNTALAILARRQDRR